MVKTQQYNKQSGNVVLAIAIAGVVVGLTAFTLIRSLRVSSSIDAGNSRQIILALQTSASNIIQHDEAWIKTIAQNPAMACMSVEGSVCPILPFQSFDLYTADSNLYMSGNLTDPNGYDLYGSPCANFSTASPHATCVIKYELLWKVDCTAACPATKISPLTSIATNIPVNITIRAVFSGPNDHVLARFNFDKYRNNFIRSRDEVSLSSACRSLGADYDPVQKRCQFQYRSCAYGKILVGFDSTGLPLCRYNNFLGAGCPPSFAPVAILKDGKVQCSKF